jgi:hypothetical protein
VRKSRVQAGRWRWGWLALVGVLSSFAGGRVVRADGPEAQRAAARELGTSGMEAYFDQDYAQAADKLDRAYRLYPTPTLGLWSARALIQFGQWVRAAERLREAQFASVAIGDNDAQRQAQADAANELTALTPRIPRLIVVVDGAAPEQVTLEIDGVPFDRKLIGIAHPSDPGHHRIVGVFQEQRVEVELELQPGASEVARVELKPVAAVANVMPVVVAREPASAAGTQLRAAEPGPKSNALRIAAIAAFSVGGAGLATSLISTLLASNKLDACQERAGDYYCSDAQADDYEMFRNVATVSFYGGAALAAAGLTLWFLQPTADKKQAVSVAAKPLGAQLTVKF